MKVEPSRRHGPFDPRWPRAARLARHLSLVEPLRLPAHAALETPRSGRRSATRGPVVPAVTRPGRPKETWPV
jgi:hypothetical protein